MIIKNIRIENSSKGVDLRVENGIFSEICENILPKKEEKVIDGKGKLLLPPFVDSHVHLDAATTAFKYGFNKMGTLWDGIGSWAEIKETRTYQDIKDSALEAIRLEIKNGVQVIRTHVDICVSNLTALKALIDLREELKEFVTLQVIAFPQDGIMNNKYAKNNMVEAVKMKVDGLGAIPHYEFNSSYAAESIRYITDLAAKNGLLVDVHCDETDDATSVGLETLATCAYEKELYGKVTASHTTAMGSYSKQYFLRLSRILALSGINFISNPLVNVSLGGKLDDYPKRRGVTRIKDLLALGMNVSIGYDDIRDPWYILGNGNIMDSLNMGLHMEHMLDYDSIMNSYRLITYNGAKTLNISKNYGIDIGKPADFIIMDAANFFDAVMNKAKILYSFRAGKLIYEGAPASDKYFAI